MNHQASKFMNKFKMLLTKHSAVTVQRWEVQLTAYSYDILYRKVESIPHAHYLS